MSVTSFQILLLQFCVNFFSFSSRTAQSESPVGATVFFLLQNVRSESWAHSASYSMDTGVKHLGREVYHSSRLSAEVMNEWSCISTFPVWLHAVDREFFLIFHMRLTCRAHHVDVMRLLCIVTLPSFKFLPAATSRIHTFSRHTTLICLT